MTKRVRKIWSIKNELLTKSREAMLASVQIFNNPNIVFKSESFIVLSNIAWTYLLHAFYREKGVDYRYFEKKGVNKKYHKTNRGAYKFWELERCLNDDNCPLDKITCSNLRFLIGLRHEIEHQMTTRIDDYLSARFQACCLNFNSYIKQLFGNEYAIDKYLAVSLQFSSISDGHIKQLNEFSELPKNIASFINEFDENLPDIDFNNPKYSYRVLYIQKAVNKKGQADKVIEFISSDSPEAAGLNKEYVLIKDREKPKFYAKDVIKKIQQAGFKKFGIHQHTLLWKNLDARNGSKGFGAWVGLSWFWYESWIREVEKICSQNPEEYK